MLTPFGEGVSGKLGRGVTSGAVIQPGSSAVVRIPFIGPVLVFPPIGQAVAVGIGGGLRQHQVDSVRRGTVRLAGCKIVRSRRDERGWLAGDQDLDMLQVPTRGGERNIISGNGEIEREDLVRDREAIRETTATERFESRGEGILAASLVWRSQGPLQFPVRH